MKFLKIEHIERIESSDEISVRPFDVIINIDHIICVKPKEYRTNTGHIYSEIVMLDNPFQETIFVVDMTIEQFYVHLNQIKK
tara:strand:+ start:327 stop:572 length:246 start_codon:yes stop_codon:yes gene_type:complete